MGIKGVTSVDVAGSSVMVFPIPTAFFDAGEGFYYIGIVLNVGGSGEYAKDMIARDYAFGWFYGENKWYVQNGNANIIYVTCLNASVTVTHVTRDLWFLFF